MSAPSILWLGENNLFIKDYYSKRIMTIVTFPFFLVFIIQFLKKKKVKLSRNITLYLFSYLLVLLNSIILGNSISLLITDAFIALLPFFFYIIVDKLGYEIKSYSKNFWLFLIIACFLVIMGVKLQFSYFSILGIIYIVFLSKLQLKFAALYILLPALITNTLIGKSSLLILIFMAFYFLLLDKKFISPQKKLYILTIPTVFIVISSIVFWPKIKETGAYKNTYYFFRHANFEELKFTDMSTSHRLYEGQQVISKFKSAGLLKNFIGNGFGATIDLTNTKDIAVKNSNNNLREVKHIHIGFFAVLYRYGLLGVLIYLLFMFNLVSKSLVVLKNTKNKAIVLSTLYALAMVLDSFISFPHMMSNFLFWLIVFVIYKKYRETLSHQELKNII